ncbi:DUF1153 domain-containing protein [Lacibacterium aquatile]|uniref:DUF1153 domain-containing protein n=1 Tax=Lacibacterium aquatile TaxID=1168082 RepID=A0ABW5DQR6_9PROT
MTDLQFAATIREETTGGSMDTDLADLPPAGTVRWVASRKAQVVNAIASGLLTLEQACTRYDLSIEEIEAWRELANHYGTSALRTTRLKEYRPAAITTRIERRGRKPRLATNKS